MHDTHRRAVYGCEYYRTEAHPGFDMAWACGERAEAYITRRHNREHRNANFVVKHIDFITVLYVHMANVSLKGKLGSKPVLEEHL